MGKIQLKTYNVLRRLVVYGFFLSGEVWALFLLQIVESLGIQEKI